MKASETKRRMSPDMREQEIVRGAVSFFAEFGFEGQTRELAKRLGVTQPLLYRYFPTKDALVERVYQEVFLRRWNPFWEELIQDRRRSLKDRLTEFYRDYSRVILTYEWVRLFMFSGLKGLDFNTRYLDLLRQKVFGLIIKELREEYSRDAIDVSPISQMEIEAVWGLHAAIFYLGVRKFIYNMPVEDIDRVVELELKVFLEGIPSVLMTR
ncbi:TetR/AcrR family transcriptional regulator (plasmid) [Phyllobacterium sp. A18/5-2]|uniref:TetR/AcrR family transcriptional regulator n=1 Tax=Phyllobacterium sp. A18/5-2 TaxID=2978392 RepID=UPI0021CA6BC2|nr:TetR/AcrR family transcriptional regulator [Phyllobacterium sp. A18/5-2]UXN67304.1 TetR/AcrR family transcriptional regulator [Phyllobacterium sp. A18/5-2]